MAERNTYHIDGRSYVIKDSERALAMKLIADGFYSTSNKYRSLARWIVKPPSIASCIKPELLPNLHVRRFLEHAKRFEEWRASDLRCNRGAEEELIERLTLSPRMYQIFRACGGHSA